MRIAARESRGPGHREGGRLVWLHFVMAVSMLAVMASGQSRESGEGSQPAQLGHMSAQEIAELEKSAESGDPAAQLRLGAAYRKGNGVPKNDELAYKWIRKSAEQGDAHAENSLGTMYRLGEGVSRDKVEALGWYQRAARHGSAEGMFNLGTCYYNGDGVASNEYTAYAWFLVAQEQGDPVANDAVQRSAATISKKDAADVFAQIGEMYDKGAELPKNDSRALMWLRKAAESSPRGMVLLAVHLLNEPDGKSHYAEAVQLCKAAATNFAQGQRCLGYLYRKGIGVDQDPRKALEWYRKAADRDDGLALSELAGMYASGEGTKIDRPEAFMAYFRASRLGVNGAPQKALALWRQMNKEDQKKTGKKLRAQSLDPDKVIAVLEALPPS